MGSCDAKNPISTVPAAAASASQPPAAHFGDNSSLPGFYSSTLCLYSQPNPCSCGISLGEGFAGASIPKPNCTGSVGTGTGLKVSPLQDLPSPRASSCGGCRDVGGEMVSEDPLPSHEPLPVSASGLLWRTRGLGSLPAVLALNGPSLIFDSL